MSEHDATARKGCGLHRGGLRASFAAFGAGLLLGLGCLSGCTGPGLEPPSSEDGVGVPGPGGGDVDQADGGVTANPMPGGGGGSPSSGASGGGGRGASGAGGAGGNGGAPSEMDASFDAGIDEDAGALR